MYCATRRHCDSERLCRLHHMIIPWVVIRSNSSRCRTVTAGSATVTEARHPTAPSNSHTNSPWSGQLQAAGQSSPRWASTREIELDPCSCFCPTSQRSAAHRPAWVGFRDHSFLVVGVKRPWAPSPHRATRESRNSPASGIDTLSTIHRLPMRGPISQQLPTPAILSRSHQPCHSIPSQETTSSAAQMSQGEA